METDSIPFLVKHGGHLWKILVGLAFIATFAMAGRWQIRRYRARSHEAPVQVGLTVGGLWAVIAATLLYGALYGIGAIALHAAGPEPFKGRVDDDIGSLSAVAIASATPKREAALDLIADADIAVEPSCIGLMERGSLDEIRANAGTVCEQPGYWQARVDLVEGNPCAAVDHLGPAPDFIHGAAKSDWPTLATRVVADLGCRKWAELAPLADLLAAKSDMNANVLRCVGELANQHVHPGAPTPNIDKDVECAAIRLMLLPPDRVDEAARAFRDQYARLFDIASESALYEHGEDLLDPAVLDAAALVAWSRSPTTFERVPTMERLGPAEPDDMLDLFGDLRLAANESVVLADRLLTSGGDHLFPQVRLELLGDAAAGDMIAGNFDGALKRCEEIRAGAQSLTPNDVGPRPRTLEYLRVEGDRCVQAIRFRRGERAVDGRYAIGDMARALFAIRTGAPVAVREFVREDEIALIREAEAGDYTELRRAIHERFREGIAWKGMIGAAAPLLPRPVPPDVLRWAGSPPSIWAGPLLPGPLASEAATRRDRLSLLGDVEGAGRWGEIAKRQWALAQADDLAVVYLELAAVPGMQ